MKIVITLIIALILGTGIFYYAFSKQTCAMTTSTSPQAPNHVHQWCSNKATTDDFCNAEGKCHNHKINLSSNLAEAGGAGPHTHTLK